MDTREFLGSVLGSGGYYCVYAARGADKRRVQKFYDSIDALLDSARQLDVDGFDVYFALANFHTDTTRKAEAVLHMKSFFLDLDCGPGKPYADQAQALAALRGFCKGAQLPRPTIVNSGRGIHVYWPLLEPVSRETWQPIAEQLKQACKARGLHADPAVCADAARVLRVPGTHNFKDDPPKDVLVVGAAAQPVPFSTFENLVGQEKNVIIPPRRYTPDSQDLMMQALSGSYTSRFRTILMKTLEGTGCGQLREIVTNQAGVSEPLWRAGLSIAKFCIDGDKAIHKISEKHADYSAEATEEKAALIKGPYLCARFDEFNTGVCPECPHWGKIKSPISLGREVLAAEEEDSVVMVKPAIQPDAPAQSYTIPKYPQPYFRGKNGGIFVHKKAASEDEVAEDKLVYHNDLYVVRRLKDPDAGESLVMRLHLPKDGVREFTIPLMAVGSKDDFRKHLAMQGVTILNVADLMDYTMRWVNELQYKAEATEAHRQFGWSDDKGRSFLLGAKEIFADRIDTNAPSVATAKLFPYFVPKGTLEGWKKNIDFFNRPGFEPYQFMIGLSFGAPLMRFQALNAAAFHLYSKQSGLGKTTAMLAGASVWGDPDQLILKEDDTHNSRMNRAEIYKDLPMYVDEMTNTKPQELSDWAYQMGSGQQRNRMGVRSNVERTRGEPWKLPFGTTGNASLIERISAYKRMPEAEAQRILEHNLVQRVVFKSKEETDVLTDALKQHYGHAGVVYIQYVMQHMDDVLALATANQRKIDVAANLTAENRFWSVLVTRTLTGLMVAKRAGLIDWDIAAVSQWAIGLLQTQKGMVKDMAAETNSLLTDYLAENYNNILRIRSTDDARGKPPGPETMILPEAVPRLHFVARYEYDIKRLYLLPKPLKDWCVRQQINYTSFVDMLKVPPTKLRREKMRLGRGTHMNLPPTDTLVIDCSSFMDDATEEALATTAALMERHAQDGEDNP